MIAEAKPIELQIDADARLSAAVGAAARFQAEAAGLDGEAVAELQKSVVAACREAMEHLTGDHPHLRVTITRFNDRLEVALSHEGSAEPATGLDRIAGLGHSKSSLTLDGVDRVQFETRGGIAVTRLTKYLGHAPHIA